MTSPAEPRTPLDDVIDDVARAMSPHTAPDLRARIGERLDRRQASFGWWQPALAGALVILAVLGWWPTRDTSRRIAPMDAPAVRSAPTSEVSTPSAQGTRASAPGRTPATAPRARRRGSESGSDVWPAAVTTIAPIAVSPITVDAVYVAPPTFDTVDVPRLVVDAIDVEPLPRSNP
jgi:hypothetical protein